MRFTGADVTVVVYDEMARVEDVHGLDVWMGEQRTRIAATTQARVDDYLEHLAMTHRWREETSACEWHCGVYGSGHGSRPGVRRFEDAPLMPGHPDWW